MKTAPLIAIILACAAGAPRAFAALPKALNNVFVHALVEGRAAGPVPDEGIFDKMLDQLKSQAGDDGPIVVQAMRVVRFQQQKSCGRVVFALAQPSSHKAWPGLGGQINICEDGQAPLRVCAADPSVLVPASSRCRDKSAPIDTPEIAAAIQAALATGGLSNDQVRQQMQQAGVAPSAVSASGAKASGAGRVKP